MGTTKKYWKGLEDLNNDPAFIKSAQSEFAEEIPMDKFLANDSLEETSTPRRDFLKFLGFSVTAASLAACQTPVSRVIPYVIKPEEITVGVSNWYATAYYDGRDFCNVLVKTREGRPIKIEGNRFSSITKGGTNSRVQASVLSLYDNERATGPKEKGSPTTWEEADKKIAAQLDKIAAEGGNISLLTSSIISPSTTQIIADFTTKYKNVKHVSYDAISYSGIIKANEQSFGKAVVPVYNFENANVIVSFACDFLTNWVSPIEISRQYAAKRKVSDEKKEMSKHYQFESNLSLTGSNADERIGIKPSQLGAALISLYNKVAGASVGGKQLEFDAHITAAAKELVAAKGKSLVVCGSNDPAHQVLVNAINAALNNYGATIDIDNANRVHQGNDAEVVALATDMKAGKVGALIMYNVNPVYSLPAMLGFEEGLKKTGLSISFNDREDETASLCTFLLPDHNYLESWGDAMPRNGHYSLIQPTIFPIFNTRSAQESLMKWTGIAGDYQSYVKANWEKNIFPMQTSEVLFDNYWMKSLHDGGVEFVLTPAAAPTFAGDVNAAAASAMQAASKTGAFEITLYEKTAIGNGNQANNPWLQEVPDPVSKVVWDNYITMSPKQMKELGFETYQEQRAMADVVEVTVNGITVKAPVFPQPGQVYGTIGLALGYGRTKSGKCGNLGTNAYALIGNSNGAMAYTNFDVKVGGSIEKYSLASTQTHHTLMGRNMVKEASLAEYKKDSKAGNEREMFKVKEGHEHVEKTAEELDLWATKDYPAQPTTDLKWSMSIDLNSCIGCGNCIVSCTAENNVPVVGKDQVSRTREMHWLRIDRYYSSDMTKAEASKDGKGKIDMYREMEIPSENPKVVFQPVMCQHCDHAPCETVCPVLATTHSSEGLNQMTYNRCLGTKYCANNCPYKVRRFNWYRYTHDSQFDFNMNNDLGRMVLNPDVSVRSRGVMEKCSMCVQRIQEVKLTAKKDGRRINDGEIQTACSQSCPTHAITFGNIFDESSEVAKHSKDERMYHMLEEIDVKPSVFYLTKIRNTEEAEA
ncbi:MAG: TAT-variant-translocated molybdopterin oxidoreductase [Bacteroidetes bacterium]|nr:TAT-variant-translocated molybdopterin oxidoreductase [Bacteroidota bacterium]